MNFKNVLSLFDGGSMGQVAINRSNHTYDNYYASEIDKNAIKVTKDNYPDTIHIGDITKVHYSYGVLYSGYNFEDKTFDKSYNVGKIDLLIGGSPCQTVSLANKGGNDIQNGKSSLFFEYLRLLQEVKPKYFLLENVLMSKKNKDIITDLLNVEPIMINSNLVSIQNRKRLYWTNIQDITQPNDKSLLFKNNICKQYDEKLILRGNGLNKISKKRARITNHNSDKLPTIMKTQEKKPTDSIVIKQDNIYRYPTRKECELMQNLPINYTKSINYRLATGLIGNGWTVDVIVHILNHIDNNVNNEINKKF